MKPVQIEQKEKSGHLENSYFAPQRHQNPIWANRLFYTLNTDVKYVLNLNDESIFRCVHIYLSSMFKLDGESE